MNSNMDLESQTNEEQEQQYNKAELFIIYTFGLCKKFFPLILIFTYIVTASVLINLDLNDFTFNDKFMITFMGLFYSVFSFFKILNIRGFVKSYKKYDIFAMYIPFYGYLYPLIEVTLAILFLYSYQLVIINFVTLVLFTENIISVGYALYREVDLNCACLGTMLNLPLTKVTIIEDLIMITMTIVWLVMNFTL